MLIFYHHHFQLWSLCNWPSAGVCPVYSIPSVGIKGTSAVLWSSANFWSISQNMHYKATVAAQHWKTNKVVWTWKDDWPPWITSTYKRSFTQEGNYLVLHLTATFLPTIAIRALLTLLVFLLIHWGDLRQYINTIKRKRGLDFGFFCMCVCVWHLSINTCMVHFTAQWCFGIEPLIVTLGTCIAIVWPKILTKTQLNTCTVQKPSKDLNQKSLAQVGNHIVTLVWCPTCSLQLRYRARTVHWTGTAKLSDKLSINHTYKWNKWLYFGGTNYFGALSNSKL